MFEWPLLIQPPLNGLALQKLHRQKRYASSHIMVSIKQFHDMPVGANRASNLGLFEKQRR